MRSVFAEAFHIDVQYTKLPLIQTEMLSYDGSLKQNFYLVVYFSSVTEYMLFCCASCHLPKMCNTHILDLSRRIFTEQRCRQESKEESSVNLN